MSFLAKWFARLFGSEVSAPKGDFVPFPPRPLVLPESPTFLVFPALASIDVEDDWLDVELTTVTVAISCAVTDPMREHVQADPTDPTDVVVGADVTQVLHMDEILEPRSPNDVAARRRLPGVAPFRANARRAPALPGQRLRRFR